MIADGKQESLGGNTEQPACGRAVLLTLILGLAVAATPVDLNVGDGSVSFSSAASADEERGWDRDRDRDDDRDSDRDDDRDGDGDDDRDGDSEGDEGSGNNAAGVNSPKASDLAARGGDAPREGVDRGVARAQFTTLISRRLPGNQVSRLDDPNQAVSFFTEVRGMQGRTITHRWTYRGAVVYEASSTINGRKWRFWSTQILPADKPGTWRVDVVDERNEVLQSQHLDYRPAG